MSFICGATAYVPLDPPGELGDLSAVSVESIEEREDGVRVVVSGELNGKAVRVSILFGHVWAYCVSNESYRLWTAARIVSAIGRSAVLHLVEGSEWIERFLEESSQFWENEGLKHYLIVTGDDWVDCITPSEPDVNWL